MNTEKILNLLEIVSNKHTNSHAAKINEIFKFWEKHKNFVLDITKKDILINFGQYSVFDVKTGKYQQYSAIDSEIEAIKYTINTQIGNTKGCYIVSVPVLLVPYFDAIFSNKVINEKRENNLFEIEFKKLKKIVSKTYQLYSKVYKVEGLENKKRLIYTNGFLLYKSDWFDSDIKEGVYNLDHTKSNIILPDYSKIDIELTNEVVIDKKELLNLLNNAKPYAPYTKKITLHLNGAVEVIAIDSDFCHDFRQKIEYKNKKGFDVADVNINLDMFKNLVDVCKNEITLSFDKNKVVINRNLLMQINK